MFAKSRRNAFRPAVTGLEFRSLTTTFEPIIAPANLLGAPVIGLPGPLPVPPPPIQTDGPIQPYQTAPMPAPTYVAV